MFQPSVILVVLQSRFIPGILGGGSFKGIFPKAAVVAEMEYYDAGGLVGPEMAFEIG